MHKILIKLLLLLSISSLTACSPEVGSDAWCEDMVEKPRGDWSTNEATAFAKNCIFKDYDDD